MERPTSPDNLSNRRRANRTLLALAIITVAFVIIAIAIMSHPLWWEPPKSTPLARSLIDENLTIPAESYLQCDFTVEATEFRQLGGFFNVIGSETETIRIYVMSDANFADWQSGQNVSQVYDSGELNSGELVFYLPANGTYHIVFDNRFSATLKKVNADIVLYYL